MSNDRRSRDHGSGGTGRTVSEPEIGGSTLIQALGGGFRSAPTSKVGGRTLTEQHDGGAGTGNDATNQSTTNLVIGEGAPSPQRDTLQRVFGRHVSSSEPHVGGSAAAASLADSGDGSGFGQHGALVGDPNLQAEDGAVRVGLAGAVVQRQQAQPAGSLTAPPTDPQTDGNGLRGVGFPLPTSVRPDFEQSLGTDLSNVRVHDGPRAAAMAAGVGARAFAVGNDVVFGAGEYKPDTASGQHLLAHEIAHTVQQRAAPQPAQFKLQTSQPGDAAESEADRAADAMVMGRPATVSALPQQISRSPAPAPGVSPPLSPSPATDLAEQDKRGKHQNHVVGTWGGFMISNIMATSTLGKYDTEAAAVASCNSTGGGGAIDLEDGKYVAYSIDPDSAFSFTYENTKIVKKLDATTVNSAIRAIVTIDGVLLRAGQWANPNATIKSLSPAELLAVDNPLVGYTQAHGKGLANLAGQTEVVNAFRAAMRDQALDVLSRSETHTRQALARMGPGADRLSPSECEILRKAAKDLARLDEEILNLWFVAHPGAMRHVPDQAEKDRQKAAADRIAEINAVDRRILIAQAPLLGQLAPASFGHEGEAKDVRSLPDDKLLKRLAGDAGEVLRNIDDTRENVRADDLNLWAVQSLVDSTIAGLGIADQRREWILQKAEQEKKAKAVKDTVITVFSVGFGIAAAFATGGAALALTAGALGLSAYDAMAQTQDYLTDKSAANTNMNPNAALVPKDLEGRFASIVLAWVAVGLDAHAVVESVRAIKAADGAIKVIDEEAVKLAKGSDTVIDKLKAAAGAFGKDETISGATKSALAQQVGTSIEIVEKMEGEIRVLYTIDAEGRVAVKCIQCGSAAKIADILLHTPTVQLLNRYQGVSGKILELWDRLLSLGGIKKLNPFPPNSQAFDSWVECEKLPLLIRDRMRTLDKGGGTLAKDAEAALQRDVEFLENEYQRHKKIIDKAAGEESSFQRGAGFVAMGEEATAEALSAHYPAFPPPADHHKYYYYRRTENPSTFEFCTMEKAPPEVKRYTVVDEGGAKKLADMPLARKDEHVAEDLSRGGDKGASKTGKKASEVVTVAGYAQHPRVYPWLKNPDGAVRSIDEAVEIARAHGVEIPDDILLRKVKGKMLPDNAYAQYFSRRGTDPKKMIRWEEFYDKDLDELVVRVSDSVFESDEAIVAVLSHEMYELNELRRIFAESGGAVSMQRLHNLINPGITKNLHDQAWDVADRLVLAMRKGVK